MFTYDRDVHSQKRDPWRHYQQIDACSYLQFALGNKSFISHGSNLLSLSLVKLLLVDVYISCQRHLKKFNAIGVKQQIILNTWHLAQPNLQNRESANE